MSELTFLLQQYGLVLVFLGTFVEQLGLPLPSYPILLVAGAVSYAGTNSIASVIAVAAIGGLLGDLVPYGLGASLGRRALSLVCKLSLSRDSCVRQTEAKFGRFGPWTLLFAKFVPGFAWVLVVLCGVTRVRIPVFTVLDGLGVLVYVALPVILGNLFHDAIDVTLATLTQWGGYGTALVALILVAYLLLRWLNRQMFIRELTMARISVEELVRLVDGGQSPTIFDVRAPETRQREGVIPGSIGVYVDEISKLASSISRDAEIVIYCSCPNEASAATAALHLKRAGFKRIRPLLGGIDAWMKAGRSVQILDPLPAQ